MRRPIALLALALATTGLTVTFVPPASAAGELWRVDAVNSVGCDSMDTEFDVTFAGLEGGGYVARTRALVDGDLYMDQGFEGASNYSTTWGIFANNSYESAPLTSFPMPAGRPVTVLLDLEKPKGTVVSSWKVNLKSCDSPVVLFNNPTVLDPDDDVVTAPQDKCPKVPGRGQSDGCPVVTRTVTVKYKVGGGPRLVGRVSSPAYQFAQRVAVTLFKKVPGRDIRLGKVRTGLTNHYSLRGARKPGKYYAVVAPRRAPAVGKVRRTVSPVFKVR